MNRAFALLLLASCTTPVNREPTAQAPPTTAKLEPESGAKPTPTPPPSTWAAVLPADAGTRETAKVANLARVPGLTTKHRDALRRDGFFVAAQATPVAKPKNAQSARDTRRAKHLFQVYERNDYVRFPSYVTVDLSIDLTHQYFDVVLRKIEQEHLAPMLTTAMRGFMARALVLRDGSKTPEAKKAAHAAAAYWAVALRLLELPAKGDLPETALVRAPWYDNPQVRAEMEEEMGKPAPPPPPPLTKLHPSLRREVDAAVAAVMAAKDRREFRAWGQKLDLTLARPRSHYAASGLLQRYFRAMTLLGMSRFTVTGDAARPEFLVALSMSIEGAPKARKAYDSVLSLTNFVVGDPPTAGLAEAGAAVRKTLGTATLDAALEPSALARVTAAWGAFTAHPVLDDGPVIQPIGQRVFADTAAMAKLLPVVAELPPDREALVARAMGAAGSAAVMGSDVARTIVLDKAGSEAAVLKTGIDAGRSLLEAMHSRDDAYHATLRALTGLLHTDPLMFESKAHQLRMLQTYAGGWALLRHDTLLYAYQMGAECDAEELTAPYGWIEPYPEVYGELRKMALGFERRLVAAGISVEAKDPAGFDSDFDIKHKTAALVKFLDKMIAWSNKELAGETFTEEERTAVAMVGGEAEWVVLTLADAYELGAGNDDMAVVADVFTFRGQALEVGVAHPELIYAVIPGPDGWLLARGAVLGYREFFVPSASRMTDEQWRARVGASKDFEAGTRPPWLAAIEQDPVGVVELPSDGKSQTRCGYYGGAFAL